MVECTELLGIAGERTQRCPVQIFVGAFVGRQFLPVVGATKPLERVVRLAFSAIEGCCQRFTTLDEGPVLEATRPILA